MTSPRSERTDGPPLTYARVTVDDTTIGTATDSSRRLLIAGLRAGMTIDLNVSAHGDLSVRKPLTVEVTVMGRAVNASLRVRFSKRAPPKCELAYGPALKG